MSLTEYAEVEQRSPEWYAQRCGMVTASAVASLISVSAPDAQYVACPSCSAQVAEPCISAARKTPTPIKTYHSDRVALAATLPAVLAPAKGDTARSLLAALAAERITQRVEPTFTNDDMWRGIEEEPRARDFYAEHRGLEVRETGFMVRDFGNGVRLGYSPDGLVGEDGLIEVKAPRQKKQLLTVLSGQVPGEHMAQVQTGLLVTGRKWLDFITWHGGMHFFTIRVEPDERWQKAITEAVTQAEEVMTDMTDKYFKAVDGLPMTERMQNPDELVF